MGSRPADRGENGAPPAREMALGPKVPEMNFRFRVHQYHDSVQPFDAITNQMLFIRRALADVGIGGEIFSRHIKPLGWSRAKDFSPNAIWNCDLLLIHHSQGSEWLPRVLKIEIPKTLVYHNITPSRYFAHDPLMAELCRKGRRQLAALKTACRWTFVNSRYSGRELEEMGFPKPRVLPLFDSRELPLPSRSAGKKHGRILIVGKITPHKNQALAVKTLHHLKQRLPEAELRLVGGLDPIYGRYVQLLAKALGLANSVHLTGKVTQAELHAEYEKADLYFSTSLHEGFGLPLVEAMAAEVPVVAFPRAAIREVLGEGGHCLKTKRPDRITESLERLITDSTERNQCLQAQHRRLQAILSEQNPGRVQESISRILSELHPPARPSRATRRPGVSL